MRSARPRAATAQSPIHANSLSATVALKFLCNKVDQS